MVNAVLPLFYALGCRLRIAVLMGKVPLERRRVIRDDTEFHVRDANLIDMS